MGNTICCTQQIDKSEENYEHKIEKEIKKKDQISSF